MKIRFGEIEIGSKFIAFGQEMIKTNEYNARTTSLIGKQNFLFQKKNLVEEILDTEKYPLYTPAGIQLSVLIDKGKVTFNEPIIYCPYIPNLIPLAASDGTIFYLDKINN